MIDPKDLEGLLALPTESRVGGRCGELIRQIHAVHEPSIGAAELRVCKEAASGQRRHGCTHGGAARDGDVRCDDCAAHLGAKVCREERYEASQK